MKNNRLLEFVSTRLIVLLVILALVLVPTSLFLILQLSMFSLDSLATFIDASLKLIAILVAAAWALNRFYLTREDASHVRVEADVSCIPSSRFQGMSAGYSLLIYRLDIVNTGKILIQPFDHYIEIDATTITEGQVTYTTIYRWPERGVHSGGPIEPSSWSAVNDAIAIPNSVQAVRIFVHIKFQDEGVWTWHKTFDIHNELSATSLKIN